MPTKELNELGPKTLKSYADKTDASENKKRPMKRMYGNLQARERLGGKFSIKNRKGKWQEKKYHAEETEMNEDEINESPRKAAPTSGKGSHSRYKDPEVGIRGHRLKHKENARYIRKHPELAEEGEMYEDELNELSRKTLGDAWYKAKNDKKKDRSYVMKKTRERLDNTSDNYEKTKNIRREEMNEDEMEPSVSDLVVHSIDQRPLDFQQSFADLMQARISDAVYEKKLDIAAGFTGANTDPSDDDYEDDGEDEDGGGDWDEGIEVESDDEDV